ncbi:MAG: hypothetical protein AB1454_07410 [Candidatus Auribacterota bacterium]
MKNAMCIAVAFFCLISTAFCQVETEEKFEDLIQYFNRIDWRIQKVNDLVNNVRWNENDLRLIKYETDHLSKLVDAGVAQLEPQIDPEEFKALADSLKDSLKALGDIAEQNKTEEIKPQANDVFKKYADFKFSFRKLTVEEMQ